MCANRSKAGFRACMGGHPAETVPASGVMRTREEPRMGRTFFGAAGKNARGGFRAAISGHPTLRNVRARR